MRHASIALALLASTQLTLLSSPAFADGGASADASVSVSTSTTTSAGASASTTTTSTTTTTTSTSDSRSKKTTGWIVLGVGAALGTAGTIIDIVGGFQGHVAGEGGAGDTQDTSTIRPNFVFAGTTMIVVGIAAMVYGGAMVYDASHGMDTTATPPPKEEEGTGDAVSKTAQARFSSVPTVSVPILGATF